MFKKTLVIMSLIVCVSIMCSCSNATLPKQAMNENKNDEQNVDTSSKQATNESKVDEHEVDTSNSNESNRLNVVRYPMLDNTNNSEYSSFYESGLLYPSQSRISDPKLEGSSKKYIINDTEYVATYYRSEVYSESDSKFLGRGNYDKYIVEGKADFEVFKESGLLKKVYIYRDELVGAKKIVSDFSEAELKRTAELVLTGLYGAEISEYLTSYYQFDYAKLMEYANKEQNRYVVCYRAYLNDIPTDDVIYVQFSLSGSLLSVSAKKYLQYLHIDETSLTAVDDLKAAIREELKKLDYSRINLRDTEIPCYYTMNTDGKLYYVMEWDGFRLTGEDTGVMCVEMMAVRAN